MVGLTSEVHHLVVLIHSSRCCQSYSWPGGGTVTRLVMNKLIMVVTQTIVRLLLSSMLRMFKFLQLMYIIAICRTSSPALCSSSTPTSCSTLQCVAEVTEVEKAIRPCPIMLVQLWLSDGGDTGTEQHWQSGRSQHWQSGRSQHWQSGRSQHWQSGRSQHWLSSIMVTAAVLYHGYRRCSFCCQLDLVGGLNSSAVACLLL